MRKILISIAILLVIVSIPVLVLEVMDHFRVQPEVVIPEPAPEPEEKPKLDKPPEVEKPKDNIKKDLPSKEFLRGYWDAQNDKWIGPLKWTFHDEYRQGYQMGTHDKKTGLERYPKPDKKPKN